jgi:hypothetical protein
VDVAENLPHQRDDVVEVGHQEPLAAAEERVHAVDVDTPTGHGRVAHPRTVPFARAAKRQRSTTAAIRCRR